MADVSGAGSSSEPACDSPAERKESENNYAHSHDSLDDGPASTDDSSGAPSSLVYTEDSTSAKEHESDEADRNSPSPPLRICDPTSKWSKDKTMYAPKTIGFPPSRSSLVHTIPTGATFVSPPKLGAMPIGGNPFAVAKPVTPVRSNHPIIPSKFTPGSLAGGNSRVSSSLLDASSTNDQAKKFSLTPSRLACTAETGNSSTSSEEVENKSSLPSTTTENEIVNSSPEDMESSQTNGTGNHSPHFVPLTVSASTTDSKDDESSAVGNSAAKKSSCGFVFGQNVHERVANADSSTPSCPVASTSNGLFASVAKPENTNADETENSSSPQKDKNKSLSESAREYEESRAVKRKYDEVTIVTGEEEESNVLQMNCKLFAFDKTNSWVERGRGQLRLNDKDLGAGAMQSRIIMRTQGSLRLILNTKVWANMAVDKPSDKSVRITAMDSDQIRVFLVMASVKDTDQLFNALEWRVTTLRSQEDSTGVSKEESSEISCDFPDTSVPKRMRPDVDFVPGTSTTEKEGTTI